MKTDEEWQEFIKQAAQEAVALHKSDVDDAAQKAVALHKSDADESAQKAVALYDETMENRFGQVMEALEGMRVNVAKIPKMEQDISELKSDMKIVKQAVKDTNDDLHNLGRDW